MFLDCARGTVDGNRCRVTVTGSWFGDVRGDLVTVSVMADGDRVREWVTDVADSAVVVWAHRLVAQAQVTTPGLQAGRLAVGVGTNLVTFDVDVSAIVAPQWASEPFAQLTPACNCMELDRWCVHAVAAVLSLAAALDADPAALDRVFGARLQAMTWIDDAFAAVSPTDRDRLYRTLQFCLHPDRRGGDQGGFDRLQSAWQRWGSTS